MSKEVEKYIEALHKAHERPKHIHMNMTSDEEYDTAMNNAEIFKARAFVMTRAEYAARRLALDLTGACVNYDPEDGDVYPFIYKRGHFILACYDNRDVIVNIDDCKYLLEVRYQCDSESLVFGDLEVM